MRDLGKTIALHRKQCKLKQSELAIELISKKGISGLIPIVNRLSKKKENGDFINNKYVRNALNTVMNA